MRSLRKQRLASLNVTAACVAAVALLGGCDITAEPVERPTREDAIPDDAVKVTPETDAFPPVVHDTAWSDPVPMTGPVNTAGGEDSPFIAPDGGMFLFWFTPDVSIPAEQQVNDGVTGIWYAAPDGRGWSEPTFVELSGGNSLEGCPTLLGIQLWFCSIRAGNYGEHDLWLAEWAGSGVWTDWRNAGARLNDEMDIGEWHVTADGDTIYFGWTHAGGLGGSDIWMSRLEAGEWTDPVNLGPAVNGAGDESRPFVTPDGTELWFTGSSRLGYHGPAVFRSLRNGRGWGPAEEIVSNYAAEPCVDGAGNVYFVHHFMDADEEMIEADIYVCQRR